MTESNAPLIVFANSFVMKTLFRSWACSLKCCTNVANTKTPKMYILDYLDKYRTLTFQILRGNGSMWLSVGYHLQISNIGPAQRTIDQKLTLCLFDQVCVN